MNGIDTTALAGFAASVTADPKAAGEWAISD
jgi:hypothetical protein